MKLNWPKKQLAPAELVGAGLFTTDALVVDMWRNMMEGGGYSEAKVGEFIEGVARSLADSLEGRRAFYRRSHEAWPAALASRVAGLMRSTHLMPQQLTVTWNELQSHTRASYAGQGAEVIGAAQRAYGGSDTFEEMRSVVADSKAAATLEKDFALVALDHTTRWLADLLEGTDEPQGLATTAS